MSILSPEIQAYLIPGEFIIWIDYTSKVIRGYIITVVFLFVLIELLSAILIYRILLTLKDKRKNTKFSASTLRIHRQLTALLGVELITPLLLVTIPLCIHLFRVVFLNEFSPRIFTQFIMICMGFYSLADGLSTIFFISPYKNHALKMFVFSWLNPAIKFLKITSVSSNQEHWATRSMRY
jgi:hypothetical protein